MTMWEVTYDLKKLVYPSKPGYDFITSTRLFIPYKEVGLQLLVRKEQILPFFYEIILTLVDCRCNEISNISEITGVEQEILFNVVGEMSRQELVYIKSGVLILTPNGKLALGELKKVVIEKEAINRMFINCITGDISDLERSHKRPTDNNPCLFETIKIDDEYISERFDDFNEYYKKRQEVYEEKSLMNIKNEIYQIIGKEYERLCYSDVKTLIYKNTRDDDLVYECDDDIGNIYGTVFSKQINTFAGARNFLRRYSNINKYNNNKAIYNTEKAYNTENLINTIKSGKSTEEFEKYYFSNRYLLDKEYIEILYSIVNLRPTEILISSGNLIDFLKTDIILLLQASLDNAKVSIICDSNEWQVEHLRESVTNTKQKKKNKIDWIERKDISQTNIIIYPYCAISIDYFPIPIGRDYILKEIADITFDTKIAQEAKESLFNKIVVVGT